MSPPPYADEHNGELAGSDNPTEFFSEYRKEMIQSEESAWGRWRRVENPPPSPIWCFQRFGESKTVLDDGRTVYIGGEHEAYYDPDFCIYNDVVVRDKRDGSIRIFLYPREVFPPTDFHSATLVDDEQIFILGCLGYSDERVLGRTPVYRLDCRTYAIHRVETTGDGPGRIWKHRALLVAYPGGTRAIRVSGGTTLVGLPWTTQRNAYTYELDVDTLEWGRFPREGPATSDEDTLEWVRFPREGSATSDDLSEH